MYPVSCVLADDEIMLTIKPGEHGSTYGGNPLAAKVSLAAMAVLHDEKLSENATAMGKIFRDKMAAFDSPLIAQVRGKGLLNAIQINPVSGKQAWDLCLVMKENGILAKPTHEHTIRFTPPLIITEPQMLEAIDLIQKSMMEFV
jgi:ornithine--oxo-acid transaminase